MEDKNTNMATEEKENAKLVGEKEEIERILEKINLNGKMKYARINIIDGKIKVFEHGEIDEGGKIEFTFKYDYLPKSIRQVDGTLYVDVERALKVLKNMPFVEKVVIDNIEKGNVLIMRIYDEDNPYDMSKVIVYEKGESPAITRRYINPKKELNELEEIVTKQGRRLILKFTDFSGEKREYKTQFKCLTEELKTVFNRTKDVEGDFVEFEVRPEDDLVITKSGRINDVKGETRYPIDLEECIGEKFDFILPTTFVGTLANNKGSITFFLNVKGKVKDKQTNELIEKDIPVMEVYILEVCKDLTEHELRLLLPLKRKSTLETFILQEE